MLLKDSDPARRVFYSDSSSLVLLLVGAFMCFE